MASLQGWNLGRVIRGDWTHSHRTKSRRVRDRWLAEDMTGTRAVWEVWDDGCATSYPQDARGEYIALTGGARYDGPGVPPC